MIRETTIKRSTVDRPMLGIPQLAERLGTTERFVRRLVCERRIPFHKVGKYVMFRRSEVDDWIDARTVPQKHFD